MPPEDRPDVSKVRHHLAWLIGVIVVAVVGLVSLTFYLYAHLTQGITVTPR